MARFQSIKVFRLFHRLCIYAPKSHTFLVGILTLLSFISLYSFPPLEQRVGTLPASAQGHCNPLGESSPIELDSIPLGGSFRVLTGDFIVTDSFNYGTRLYNMQGQEVPIFPGTPVFNTAGNRYVIYDYRDNTSHLFDQEHNALAILEGRFGGFSLHDSRITMYAEDGSKTRIYDLNGQALFELKGGDFVLFSGDGRRIAIQSRIDIPNAPSIGISYLYDGAGNELATMPGTVQMISDDHQRLVGSHQDHLILYDMAGQEIASVPATNRSFEFIPGTHQLLLHHYLNGTTLETLYFSEAEGAENPPIKGEFRSASPKGDRWITDDSFAETTYLYDDKGSEIATLPGLSHGFSPDGNRLVTTLADTARTFIYDTEGTELLSLPGAFSGFSPTGDHIVTTQHVDETSHIYDSQGNLISSLAGLFAGFNHDGSRMVTFHNSDDHSRLYDSQGNELAHFTGNFETFIGDGNAIISTVYPDVLEDEVIQGKAQLWLLPTPLQHQCSLPPQADIPQTTTD